MAFLTRPDRYDINDSNIALFGSDIEKKVHERAGDKESAWNDVGKQPGLQCWRIESFDVKAWPQDKAGTFYDGDSYIVLHTYKKNKQTDTLSYDLHFWLGSNTSQDEAGTAAYKTVELDDHLGGMPVQYREVQGNESSLFLSYFPHFHCLHGGVATGFHHVSHQDPDEQRLFVVKSSGHHNAVYQLPVEGDSFTMGSVFVLDKGTAVWQFNKKDSHGKDRFKAAELTRQLADSRKGHCDVKVFEENGQGAGIFLSELKLQHMQPANAQRPTYPSTLLLANDASEQVTFEVVSSPPKKSDLTSNGLFVLDATGSASHPAIYLWIGKDCSTTARKQAVQLAQVYLHQHETLQKTTNIVRVDEGRETSAFTAEVT